MDWEEKEAWRDLRNGGRVLFSKSWEIQNRVTAGKNDANRSSQIPVSLTLRRLPHNTDYVNSEVF